MMMRKLLYVMIPLVMIACANRQDGFNTRIEKKTVEIQRYQNDTSPHNDGKIWVTVDTKDTTRTVADVKTIDGYVDMEKTFVDEHFVEATPGGAGVNLPITYQILTIGDVDYINLGKRVSAGEHIKRLYIETATNDCFWDGWIPNKALKIFDPDDIAKSYKEMFFPKDTLYTGIDVREVWK